MTNRSIRFRAWNGKHMFHDDEIAYHGGDFGYLYGDDFHSDTSYIPMQFTGMFDRNGEEIYEGDIVKLNIQDHNGRDHNFDCKITFKDTAFLAENKHTSMYLIYVQDSEDIEVVGNVHENPEMYLPDYLETIGFKTI